MVDAIGFGRDLTSIVSTISVRNVIKGFGELIAVDDLTFEIESGEVVGFLGPNGAGKTTTMRLLANYFTPDSGSIWIKGVNAQAHQQEAKAYVGFLPENNPLYGDLTVHEYLSLIADLRGITPEIRSRNLERTVDETDLSQVYYRPINQLSKGNRQRVGLAQAILHEPEILILDEPTEGLDPNQRLVIRDLIRSLGRDRTVILSTHVLGEVETTCDRILVINQGVLVADSPVKQLLEQAGGVKTLSVELEGDDIEAHLGALVGTDQVEFLGTNSSRNKYKILVPGEEDLRPILFNLAKQRNWVLWELHQEDTRLEDVFRSLTLQEFSDED